LNLFGIISSQPHIILTRGRKDMPTKKPIISIVLDDDTLKKIEDFQFENRIPSRSKALNEIIKIGMDQLKKEENKEG
jgi:hypothetical protein